MSGDESALQHPEHGRSEFRDAIDNAAGIGKKGEDGCVCDAYSVHFQAELSGLSDGGLSELGVSGFPPMLAGNHAPRSVPRHPRSAR